MRAHLITVRVTKEEREQIKQLAQASEMSTNQFARRKLGLPRRDGRRAVAADRSSGG